jgi:hypothetical protein
VTAREKLVSTLTNSLAVTRVGRLDDIRKEAERLVDEAWVRTTAEVDTDDETFSEYDLDLWGHPSLGKVSGHWEGDWPNREYVKDGYEGPDEARYDRVEALSGALQSGAFDNVLLENFGDHAMVTVRKDGIEVEFYSHD